METALETFSRITATYIHGCVSYSSCSGNHPSGKIPAIGSRRGAPTQARKDQHIEVLMLPFFAATQLSRMAIVLVFSIRLGYARND